MSAVEDLRGKDCSNAGWRAPDPGGRGQMGWGETWRTCRYCGSIHPDDLTALLVQHGISRVTEERVDEWARKVGTPEHIGLHDGLTGLVLDEADWKYGWPHKVYVHNIPVAPAMAGRQVESGGRTVMTPEGIRSFEPTYSTVREREGSAKFYTRHLHHAADFERLAALLHEAIPTVTWSREGDRIMWRGHPGPGVYG